MRSRIFTRNRLVLIGDLFLIIVAALGSFALRLDLGPFFIDYLNQAIWLSAIALILKPLVFYVFGLYRRLWAYASIYELMLIILAVSTASVLVSVTVILLLVFKVLPNFPRGVLPIDWLLSMGLIGGSRFALRVLAEAQSSSSNSSARSRRVLVVGAGDAGARVVENPNRRVDPGSAKTQQGGRAHQDQQMNPAHRAGICNPPCLSVTRRTVPAGAGSSPSWPESRVRR